MPHARRLLGDAGEHLVARALTQRGWRVLARNARTRYGEIDLVCHDGDGYVFVEVKTRRAGSFVPAVEAVGGRKRDRLERLAEAWLALENDRDAPRRLVLAALTIAPGTATVRLVDIIE